MSVTVSSNLQTSISTWKDRHQPQTFTDGRTEPSYEGEWYERAQDHLPAMVKQLLRDYSGIPEEDIEAHICRVRGEAWTIFPCSAIGVFRSLNFGADRMPMYQEVLRRLRASQTFLHLGCCIGQDIRKLVSDGAPSENIIGVDVEGQLAEVGYELFKDRSTLKTRFHNQNIFDSDFLTSERGNIDIVYLDSSLHPLTPENQKALVTQLGKLLRRRPGSMVFGRHLGIEADGEYRVTPFGWDLYQHSHNAVADLFDFHADGDWEVESQLTRCETDEYDNDCRGLQSDETRQMTFVATRTTDIHLGGPLIDSVRGPHSTYHVAL